MQSNQLIPFLVWTFLACGCASEKPAVRPHFYHSDHVKAYLEARPKQERVCLHTCFFGFELGKSTYVDWAVNHKRIYRVYCLEGLQMRHKPPQRRVSAKLREDRTDAVRPNQC